MKLADIRSVMSIRMAFRQIGYSARTQNNSSYSSDNSSLNLGPSHIVGSMQMQNRNQHISHLDLEPCLRPNGYSQAYPEVEGVLGGVAE